MSVDPTIFPNPKIVQRVPTDGLVSKCGSAATEIAVRPAADYMSFGRTALEVWCYDNAVYGIPTQELIEFLDGKIKGRRAIEIGSGNGCFGRALGIPRTDSKIQEQRDIRLLYGSLGQRVVTYGTDVEKLEALEAVEKYQPDVVFGSWITEIWTGERGSVHGVDEERLLQMVPTYIMFGSVRNHSMKSIARHKCAVVQAPWMLSRADDAALFIWDRVGA